MDESDPYWSDRPFDRWRARWDLIASAAHSRRTEGGEVLRRGEVLASYSVLRRRWGWDRTKVRRFLGELVESETIAVERTSAAGSVYRIVKYETYQLPAPEPGAGREGAAKAKKEKPQADAAPAPSTPPQDDPGRSEEGFDPFSPEGLPFPPREIDTEEMRQALARRIKERKGQGKRHRLTPESAESLYRDLARAACARGIEHAIHCVDRATASHYQGVVFSEDKTPDGNGDQKDLFRPASSEESSKISGQRF